MIPSPTASTTSFIIPPIPPDAETGSQPKEVPVQVNVDPRWCVLDM